MTDLSDPVRKAALTWLVQVNDPEFTDWDGWEAWMAQDPRHADVYWQLAEDEADVRDALAHKRAEPVVIPFRRPVRRRWLAAGIGIAASVAGAVWLGWTMLPQPWSVETEAGEQQSVTLPDGTRLHLDGATRLTMDRRSPRSVTLDAGRALFEVTHDDRRPFTVAVEGATITDLGTVFDVTRLSEGVRVAVSEGVVRFDQAGLSKTLQAGDGLTAINGRVSARAVSVDAVTGWRAERLSYENEALSVVAQDLARATGRTVTVDPVLASRSFSGSVGTAGSGDALRARLELLLGVSIVEDGAGWRLEPKPGR